MEFYCEGQGADSRFVYDFCDTAQAVAFLGYQLRTHSINTLTLITLLLPPLAPSTL